ncbi:hypothetical protein HYS47_01150 [Candidatus Woesearchaeota archaeon]|nr:hypothetical protein [Candidatus Woesearchaeota archaeon]
MGCGCTKCRQVGAVLLLLLGVLFLLVDLGTWTFWNVQWWTAAFLLFGLTGLCKARCPECKKMCK